MLSEKVRQRGLIALLIDVFCMYTGFFMVIPLISIHYVDGLGWAAATIGLILGVRQIAQQGLTLFGGMLADQVGAKGLICAGLFVRITGFVLLAWANTLPLLFVASILAALGGALFESPRAAAIAALTRPEERQHFYSLAGAISGIGMAIGPLLGAALLHVDFAVVALVGATCFAINLIQTFIMLPPIRVSTGTGGMGQGIKLVLRDQQFLIYTALIIGFWFIWVQLNMSLPLIAQHLTGTSDSVGVIYAVNSIMMIGLQYPLLRFLTKHIQPLILLTLGLTIISIGIGSVALASGMMTLIASIIIFSLGGLLIQPTHQTVTASLANQAALGSYFGVSSLALAIGGGLGNYSGGLLYGLGEAINMPALPWLVFCAVGLISAVGLGLMHLHQLRTNQQTENRQPESSVVAHSHQ